MKNKILICFSLVFILSIYHVNANYKAPTDSVNLRIDGVGCPYCSAGFIKQVKTLGKISDIAIDYDTGTFKFKIPSDKEIDIDDLKNVVKKAGYTLITATITRPSGETLSFNAEE